MTITIHQPNFMPWYPFFQKMADADLFVFLNHCQFEKNGYQNRFNYGQKWYTMSIFKGLESINKKKYVKPKQDWEKIKNSLKEFNSVLSTFDDFISDSLVETNTNIIRKIAEILGIDTKIVFDYETNLNATDRLVKLCKDFNADTYISGVSGKKYLDVASFNREGIKVIYQNEQKMNKKSIVEFL